MPIDYKFIRVRGITASEDHKVKDSTYDSAIGVYRCIDIGTSTGNNLTPYDRKEILDYEKSVWDADAPSNGRSTILYWDSYNNWLCINILGYFSKNVTALQTPDKSTHVDGILIKPCRIDSSRSTDADTKSIGSFKNDAGQTVYISIKAPMSDKVGLGYMSICGHDVGQQSLPESSKYLFQNNYNSDGYSDYKTVFTCAKTANNKLSGLGYAFTTNRGATVAFQDDYLSGMMYSGQTESLKCGSVSTKSIFNVEDVITNDTETAYANEAFFSAPSMGSANSIFTHNYNNLGTPVKFTTMTKVSNSGNDPFGLLANPTVAETLSIFIPTLQGEILDGELRREARIDVGSTINNFNGAGSVAYFNGYPTASGQEYVARKRHRVCAVVEQNGVAPKYAWSDPIEIKFSTISEKRPSYENGGGTGAFISPDLNRDSNTVVYSLVLDMRSISSAFNLEIGSTSRKGVNNDGVYIVSKYTQSQLLTTYTTVGRFAYPRLGASNTAIPKHVPVGNTAIANIPLTPIPTPYKLNSLKEGSTSVFEPLFVFPYQ